MYVLPPQINMKLLHQALRSLGGRESWRKNFEESMKIPGLASNKSNHPQVLLQPYLLWVLAYSHSTMISIPEKMNSHKAADGRILRAIPLVGVDRILEQVNKTQVFQMSS